MINQMYALSRWMWLLSHGDVTFQQEARDATLSEGFVPPECMAECWVQGCWPRHRFISTSAAAAAAPTLGARPNFGSQTPTVTLSAQNSKSHSKTHEANWLREAPKYQQIQGNCVQSHVLLFLLFYTILHLQLLCQTVSIGVHLPLWEASKESNVP